MVQWLCRFRTACDRLYKEYFEMNEKKKSNSSQLGAIMMYPGSTALYKPLLLCI